MRIVLRKDVEKVGRRGEVVKVTAGYARNYLLPKHLALQATPGNLKRIELERKVLEIQDAKEQQEAASLAEQIAKISCTAVRKVGDNEVLYGSVTSADVAEMLEKEGYRIDKRKVLLDEPIKSLGIYEVPIKLHSQVTATLKVWVVKE